MSDFQLTNPGRDFGSPCDLCGMPWPGVGIGWHAWSERHRGKMTCRARARRREFERRGWKTVKDGSLSKVLAQVSERAETQVKRRNVYKETWAPAWAIRLAERMQKTALDVPARQKLLRQVGAEPDLQAVVMADGAFDMEEVLSMARGSAVTLAPRRKPPDPNKPPRKRRQDSKAVRIDMARLAAKP